MRKRPRLEDIVVGLFVFLAVLYPAFVAYLIHIRGEERGEVLETLRRVYLVLMGAVDCKESTEVSKLIEPDLLRRIGGEEGIKRICERNKEALGETFSLSERLERNGDLLKLEVEVKGEKAMLLIGIRAKVEGERVKVKELRYVQRG